MIVSITFISKLKKGNIKAGKKENEKRPSEILTGRIFFPELFINYNLLVIIVIQVMAQVIIYVEYLSQAKL